MVIVHSKLLVYWRVSGTSTRDLSTQLWQKCDVINLNGFTRMGCTPLQVAMGKPSSQRKIIIPTFSWVQISELEQRLDWLKLKESFFLDPDWQVLLILRSPLSGRLTYIKKNKKKVSKVVFPTILGFQCGPVFLFENPLLRPSTPTQAGRSAPPTSMVFIQPWMWSEDPQGEAFTT